MHQSSTFFTGMYLIYDYSTLGTKDVSSMHTPLWLTLLKNMTTYDKFTSLSNGLCLQAHGKLPWTCRYIDKAYQYNNYENTSFLMNTIDNIHPGAIAFSFDAQDSMRKYAIDNTPDVSININEIMAAKVYACPSNSSKPGAGVRVTTIGGFDGIEFVNFTVSPTCPMGFVMEPMEQCGCHCVCMTAFQTSKYKCDVSKVHFTAPPKYWTGLNQGNEILFGSNCPPHYCNFTLVHLLLIPP